jgi:hypothetical protein
MDLILKYQFLSRQLLVPLRQDEIRIFLQLFIEIPQLLWLGCLQWLFLECTNIDMIFLRSFPKASDDLLNHLGNGPRSHVSGRSREDGQCGLHDEILESLIIQQGRIAVVLLEMGIYALHDVLHLVDSYILIQLVIPQQFPHVR